jgi:hypothetical protein
MALYLHPQFIFMAWSIVKHRTTLPLPYLTIALFTTAVRLRPSSTEKKQRSVCRKL